RPSALSSRQYPYKTLVTPTARARAANSLSSRDLPTPASPPMSTADGWPCRTRSKAASSAASSSARPTNTGAPAPTLTNSIMSPHEAGSQGFSAAPTQLRPRLRPLTRDHAGGPCASPNRRTCRPVLTSPSAGTECPIRRGIERRLRWAVRRPYQLGGSRATGATGDCYDASPLVQHVSDLIDAPMRCQGDFGGISGGL